MRLGRERQVLARGGLGPDLIDLVAELLGGARHPERIVDVDQRLARPEGQVVEHRGEPAREEARKQRLDPVGGDALADAVERLAEPAGRDVDALGGGAGGGLGCALRVRR